jgi:hypothetical protein
MQTPLFSMFVTFCGTVGEGGVPAISMDCRRPRLHARGKASGLAALVKRTGFPREACRRGHAKDIDATVDLRFPPNSFFR